eukprot:g9483.t1
MSTVFPRIKFNTNIAEYYDHRTSPVIHRSTILITDTITLKERKTRVKCKGRHLPKLRKLNNDYQNVKPENPFYAISHDIDGLTPEELASHKIQNLKSKWNRKDKKKKVQQNSNKENVISMSQSVLFGTIGSKSPKEKQQLQNETKEVNRLMKSDPAWSPPKRKRSKKLRSSSRNKKNTPVGKLKLCPDQIRRLDFVLKNGYQKQQFNIAEQSVLRPIKLSKEMKLMVTKKVKENISVNLNYIKTGHRLNNNNVHKNKKKNRNNNKSVKHNFKYSGKDKTGKADIIHVDMWQDAVLSQYAEELDFDKLALENPFVIRQDVIEAVCEIQDWWREIRAMRYYASTRISSFIRGYLVRHRFYTRAHEVHCAVTIIQNFALKVIHYRFRKKVNACIVIQCSFRSYTARKLVSVIKIQNAFRRYLHLSQWWRLSSYILMRLNRRKFLNAILYLGTKSLQIVYNVRKKIKYTIKIQTRWRICLAKTELFNVKSAAILYEKHRKLEEDTYIHINLRRIQNDSGFKKQILKNTSNREIKAGMKLARNKFNKFRKHINQYKKYKMENAIPKPIDEVIHKSALSQIRDATGDTTAQRKQKRKKRKGLQKRLTKTAIRIHYDYIKLLHLSFLSYDFEETGMINHENGFNICKQFVPNMKIQNFNDFFNKNRTDSKRGLVVPFSAFAYWLYTIIVNKENYIYNRAVRTISNMKRWLTHNFVYSRYRAEAKRKIVYFHENDIISKYEQDFRKYKPPNHVCSKCSKPFALYQVKYYHERFHHMVNGDSCVPKNNKIMKTRHFTQLDLDLIHVCSKIIANTNIGE